MGAPARAGVQVQALADVAELDQHGRVVRHHQLLPLLRPLQRLAQTLQRLPVDVEDAVLLGLLRPMLLLGALWLLRPLWLPLAGCTFQHT